MDTAVTILVSREVEAGRGPDFERWAHHAIERARTYPGFLGGTLLQPGKGIHDWHIVYRFENLERATTWEESGERARLLAEIDGWTAQPRVRRVSGLETWFTPPGMVSMTPPPRWKMWLLSMVAAYPIVLLLAIVVSPHIGTWPVELRALVVPVVTLTLMTFVVMPRVTRWTRRFLHNP